MRLFFHMTHDLWYMLSSKRNFAIITSTLIHHGGAMHSGGHTILHGGLVVLPLHDSFNRVGYWLMKRQSCHHIETSQMVCIDWFLYDINFCVLWVNLCAVSNSTKSLLKVFNVEDVSQWSRLRISLCTLFGRLAQRCSFP